MGRNLAEYRLYKSIGYSDAEIELMQQDAKIIQDSLYMVNVQERIIELTKYHYYNSDGSWMPGGSKFWDERFEEEWKRKLEKDKFMPHSKREQYKNIVALELSELVEQYINHYGIVGNELMNIATDEFLEYLTRPQNTAPPEADSREQEMLKKYVMQYDDSLFLSNEASEFIYCVLSRFEEEIRNKATKTSHVNWIFDRCCNDIDKDLKKVPGIFRPITKAEFLKKFSISVQKTFDSIGQRDKREQIFMEEYNVMLLKID